MSETEVPVYCYWNGCIKYGTEGVYYEGPTPRRIIVNPKIALNRLLDEMYVLAGVDIDKERSKVKVFGRYPSVVGGESTFQYLLMPVVNSQSLETMLEVPSKHPCIKNVELYLEVIDHPGRSSKRQRTTGIAVKVEMDCSNGLSEEAAEVINLTGEKDSDSGGPDTCLSGLWLEDHDLRVGLCFRDVDEVKKAVDWCSIKGLHKCIVRETGTTGEFMSECIRWNCKWSLGAAKLEKHGLFEIIKYTGPHTCRPIEPANFNSEFEADEIEPVVRVHPTLSFAELSKWWRTKTGYGLETKDARAAKEEAVKRVFGGDWDQSFEDLPKLMSAFRSSNGLLVDWRYDLFPNPKFASFSGVFWAFPQSIQGFQHCRPLIIVDTKELNGKYQLKLMIASGLDAANKCLPLAFAVTKEVSSDSWRWFLTNIREKVTQRKDLCLISSPHPDILAVINEPGQSQWGYHRFCLKQFCSHFCREFPGYNGLKSLLWRAGMTRHREKFENNIETIKKDNPEARRRLDQTPQSQWALAHDGGRRYGIMEIDTAALFSVCRGFELADHVLTGSLLLLFDELRVCFNERSLFSRFSLNCGDVYTKPVMDKLEEFRKASVAYVVMPLENNAFQVAVEPSGNDKWIVQLSDYCTCTCGDFQKFKFPCLHALAVCKKLKINPLQYVDDCYTCERYYKTYSAAFSPVPKLSAWQEDSGVPRLFPPVIPPPPPPPPPTPYVAYKAQRKTTPKTGNKKS
ncbi:unnamed protein product [Brassica rapa]|uniref:SWIM-type domain-containing protein n=1 Tax=Brassica campestris TaxID=3711 RepID=A0A3P5YPD6_BRACM|nr:unnamed protein product [Brassica rapa]VDC64995.1 unnamed protein product [Brassica rapa]